VPDIAADPHVGSVLQGRYRVVERLASGGMGVVYRGERVGLGRAVAIKFIWPWIAQEAQIRKRFEIEAQAMSRLTHPSCVAVIDFGIEGDAPYLVMDFAAGPTLGAVLKQGRLPVAQSLHIVRQILAGLAHAHGQGIIHRDIKPDNIVLSETSGFGAQVRILDFGLAKLTDASASVTTGLALGTPSYMAPEQTCGDPVDVQSDIYAVGVVLFEMLTGVRPFRSESVPELMRMHRETPAPALRAVAPDAGLSGEMEAVLARALAKMRQLRFASAAEFAAALDATPEAAAPRRDAPVTPQARATVPARPAVRPPPAAPRSRRWAWAVAGSAGVAIVGAIVAWAALRPASPPAGSMASALVATETAAPPAPSRPAPVADEKPAMARAPRARVEREHDAEPPPAPQPDDVPGLAQAEALVRAGHGGAALELLRKLRLKYPEHARVAYLMGNVYFDRMWWGDGFEAYRVAVRDPAYRQDPTLITNVVKSLISERYGGVGTRFIEREVGAAAVPYLQDAARSKSQSVHARASRLLAKLNPR
jgi:serine/threonine-protein kinase